MLVVRHLLRHLLLLGVTLRQLELELRDAVSLGELLPLSGLLDGHSLLLNRLVLKTLPDAYHLRAQLPHLVLLLAVVLLERLVLLAQELQLVLIFARVTLLRRRRTCRVRRALSPRLRPATVRRGHPSVGRRGAWILPVREELRAKT